jgi:hypothetical protein
LERSSTRFPKWGLDLAFESPLSIFKGSDMQSRLILVIVLAAVAVILVTAGPSAQERKDKPPQISVADFRRDNVIGLLGHTLGTVVRVTGVTIDGDTTRHKADAGHTLLQVEMVNGAKLEKPVRFYLDKSAAEDRPPKFGSRFDYYVHESGEFSGVVERPKGLSIEIEGEGAQHDGFHYRPRITIHKSL